jgi:LuxR family maltose regulon positive regulatory protein
LRDQEYLLLARLRLAQEKPDEAGRILSPLANDAEAGERKATLIETLALQALVLFAQGEKGKASAVLSKGLALAEPEGFVRVFVDAGERMRILLAEAALQLEKTSDQDSQPSQAYVTRLLEAFPAQPSLDAPPPASNQFAGLVEQLSPRELVVLQLIAAGDSNRTIAGKLFITLSAVKKHTANIYGKLGVNSRTQAIARARQLNILPSDQ